MFGSLSSARIITERKDTCRCVSTAAAAVIPCLIDRPPPPPPPLSGSTRHVTTLFLVSFHRSSNNPLSDGGLKATERDRPPPPIPSRPTPSPAPASPKKKQNQKNGRNQTTSLWRRYALPIHSNWESRWSLIAASLLSFFFLSFFFLIHILYVYVYSIYLIKLSLCIVHVSPIWRLILIAVKGREEFRNKERTLDEFKIQSASHMSIVVAVVFSFFLSSSFPMPYGQVVRKWLHCFPIGGGKKTDQYVL